MAGSFIKPGRRCQPTWGGSAKNDRPPHVDAILPVRGHMTQGTVQLVAGILCVILIAIVILRRKGKKSKSTDDEF